MGRPLSVRRPTLEVARREAERIFAKQDAAIRRHKAAVISWGEHDPRTRALHEETALSEKDLATLESVSNIAAKLEKVTDVLPKKKVSSEKAKAALDALEQTGPPKSTPPADEDESKH